jgi:hypothetical protein
VARDILDVWIRLDRVYCFDEGDGWGSAEPYLWPVFFKIDGDSVVLTEALTLSGTATVMGTYGSHGNLVNTDVDPGENLPIPEALGSWRTNLKPIPVQGPLASTIPDVAGVAGVIAVLMEEDNVSDSGAKAGYSALVDAVRTGLDGVIGTLGFTKQEVTDQDIAAIEAAAEEAVKDAIKSNQGFFSNLWSWLNADDQIGSEVFRFSHDELAEGNIINFTKRWKSNGDWQLFGHANASVLCPAEAVGPGQAIIDAIFNADHMAAMRSFRDERFPDRRGAVEWWTTVQRNAAALSWLFQTDDAARDAMKTLGPKAAELAAHPDKPMSDEVLRAANRVLAAAAASPDRRLRIDARRASSFLELARGRSLADTVDLAAELPPARKVSSAAISSALERKSPARRKR